MTDHKQLDYTEEHMRTMEGLEHIRALPEMYIKSRDTSESLVQIFKEVFDNSADEVRANVGRMLTIDVVFFRKGQRYQMLIRDQGRGVPITKLQDAFTEPRTSGKFKGTASTSSYVASTGVFGVGAKATTALSSRFVAISHRAEGLGYVEVIKGNIKRSEVLKASDCKGISHAFTNTGTVVFFEPDASIFSTTSEFMTGDGYSNAIALVEFMTTYIPNLIARVFVVDAVLTEATFDRSAVELWDYLTSVGITDGIPVEIQKLTPKDYVRYLYGIQGDEIWNIGTLTDVVENSVNRQRYPDDAETLTQLAYDIELFMTKDFTHTGLVSAVNMTRIDDPSAYHISGLMDAIKQILSEEIEDKELRAFFMTTYKLPISGSIMVKFHGAIFVGQTKDSFKDKEFLAMYRSSLNKRLKANTELFWENFFELIKEDLIRSYNHYTQKDLKIGKSLKNAAHMIQSVFYPCRLKNNTDTEIFLTEGDSAGGQVSKARDTDTQAVFQLKGKPPNAMRIKVSKLMQNVVFRDLARILGVGPTDTDLKNMNFRNIGILVDADPDGYHISSLLIGNLYKLNPLILEEGRVFLANPPLYTMTVKNSSAFIRDTHALMDMRINRIYRSCIEITIRGSSKKLMKLSGEPYREFCYLVRHIGGTIKQVATKLVIDPMIVEMLTHCVDHIEPGHVNPQAIAKILGLKQVFYHADSNSLILNAGVDITVPLSNLALEIRKYILPHLERIRWRDFDIWCTTPITKHYNNTAVSLMQLYSIFDAVDSAYPVHRIKGLGEMTRLQLLETCTNPQTRTQTVITSVGDVDRLYAMLGVDVSARKTLIDSDMEEDTDSLEREG